MLANGIRRETPALCARQTDAAEDGARFVTAHMRAMAEARRVGPAWAGHCRARAPSKQH